MTVAGKVQALSEPAGVPMELPIDRLKQASWAAFAVAILALIIAAAATVATVNDHRQDEALSRDGRLVSATVVEVSQRSRAGVTQGVIATLPDGRRVEVDLTEQPALSALKPGDSIRILVDPNDITRNRSAEAEQSSLARELVSVAGPAIAISALASVIALLLRRSRTAPRT